MKKSLIALTVASAAATSAFAVDLNTPTSKGAVTYASEITISGTGIEVATAETVTAELGFTITSSAPRFIRYDLTNGASFVGDPTLSISVGAPGIVTSTGGDGESFVLFEVSSTTTIPNTAIATLSFAAPPTASLGLAGSTTVSYNMYEFGAGGGNGLLASAGPNSLASFSPALAVGTSATTGAGSATPVEAPKDIEVADDSINFEGGGLFTALGSLYVANTDPIPVTQAGADALIGTLLTSHEIELEGDFSAAENVYLVLDTGAGGQTCSATPAPGLLGGDIATDTNSVLFEPLAVSELGDIVAGDVTAVVTVCMEVDGETVIPEASYTGTYMPTAASGYTVADREFTLATLGNTGTTIPLNLQLTPTTEGGVYKNYFRVTNTSSTEGRVFFRLINDEGESSASIDMEEVYSDGVNTVPGGGSSRQFDIDAVYAAVQAADPTFSVGDAPRRKLRTIVTGEFGSMEVQTYTVSSDETTFSTF